MNVCHCAKGTSDMFKYKKNKLKKISIVYTMAEN